MKYFMTILHLGVFIILASISNSHAQHFVVRAPFIIGTSYFADSIKLAEELKDVGNYCLSAYDLNTVDVGIGAFRCSEDEPENLWLERMTKFVRLLYELHPRFKTMPMKIFYDPHDRPFRELYLPQNAEIGASFLMVNKK